MPSDVWRHFTQVDVKGKPLWTCKYCGKAYGKNATKLQMHIFKCQQFLQAHIPSAKGSTSAEPQPIPFDSGPLPSASGNSSGLFDYWDSMDEHSQRNADECFARAVYATGSPLTLPSNVYWQRFFNILRPAYNPPTAHALSTHLLDEEFERVQATVKQTITKAESISVISKGWSNVQGAINYIVTTPQPVYYKSSDTSEHRHTGAFIAEELKKVIEEVGPGKVFALVTDSAANMEEAWTSVEQTYPHIATIGCASHSFNLFFKYMMTLRSMDTLYQIATQIVKCVKGNQVALTIYVSKQKQKNKSVELKLYSNTNGGGVAIMFDSLLDGRESLQEMALSQTAEIERELQRILLDNVFWERLCSGLSILKPVAKAIAKIEDDDAVLSDVVGLFAELKDGLQAVLPSSLLLEAEEAAVLDSVEKHRKFCQKPLHAAAFMLDPKYDGCELSGEEVSSAYTVITTFANHLGLDSGKVLGSFAKYRTKEGLWKEEGIWRSCRHISACTWWNGLCASEAIAPVASTILRVPPSTLPLKGNVQTKVHNQLTEGRGEKLAAVRTNLRLFETDREPSPARLESESVEDEVQMENNDWSQNETFEET